MLRFRLYDLDVVVRKTVVAGVLAVFVGVVYAAFVAAGSLLVGSNDTTIAVVAAVVLAVAFQPVRIRARRFADRLVYGKRANPYEVLTEFSSRVGGAYATEDVVPRMAQILGEGAGAKVARVWLRVGRELRPSASWPSDATAQSNVAIDGDAVPTIHGAYAAAVRDRGELLGALSVEMPASDPMTPDKERLVADLASQAGLVLRNVALVEELRESRRRLVAAQDHERRKLERNIHDGAQQQLVALAVKARLARQFVARDPAKTEEMLGQIEAETQTALDDLRDLARGIYPPLLADKGLGSALDAQARKAPFPVRVDADGVGRLPQDVEAAVYFSCLEALQNVAKYAAASEATITITRSPTLLTFAVTDDGRGFDPTAMASGGGLEGLADRLAAIGGTFDLRTASGSRHDDLRHGSHHRRVDRRAHELVRSRCRAGGRVSDGSRARPSTPTQRHPPRGAMARGTRDGHRGVHPGAARDAFGEEERRREGPASADHGHLERRRGRPGVSRLSSSVCAGGPRPIRGSEGRH